MWAAVIRAMSGMGRAASAAAKNAGQRAAAAARNAGQAMQGWANQRNPAGAPRGPVPPVKPQINYASMMGQAGNPNAYAQAMQNAINRAQQHQQAQAAGGGQAARPANAVGWMRSAMSGNPAAASNMPSLGDLTDSLFGLVKSATGLENAQDAVAKTLQGDFLGAAKDAGTAMLKLAFIVPMVGAALKKWSEGVLESRRELQHFNGGIAAAFGRLDIQQFRLNLRTANATSGTTQGLAESVMRLRENTQAIREFKTNVGNLVGSGASMLAERLTRPLNNIADRLNRWIEKLEGIDASRNKVPSQMFIDDLAKGVNAPHRQRIPALTRIPLKEQMP